MKKENAALIRKIEDLIRKKKIQYFNLRICDLTGRQVYFTIPVERFVKNGLFDKTFIEEGVAIDGSSLEGFKSIEQSDTLAIPDLSTATVDSVEKNATLIFICNLKEPEDLTDYWRDPRAVAQRAEIHLNKSGIADTAHFGPEIEFFLFDNVSWKIREGYSYLNVVSKEGGIGEYDDDGKTYRVRSQEGYFVLPPYDSFKEVRDEMVEKLRISNIEVERDTHERATAGSAEIDIKYDSLVSIADKVLLFKYIVKNVAKKSGLMATFMPKPLFGHNGSGMHTHHSLWKKGRPVFYSADGKYHKLSELAMYYIGGLLTHAKALAALTSPSVNSYKRLVPGFEAPTTIAFGYRNRSTCARIPSYPTTPGSRRVEFRIPDPSANPYLCFSAILMAGLDGVKRKIDPIKKGFGPLEKSGYELSKEEKAQTTFIPGSLNESLDHLEKDHNFLLEGGVFTQKYVKLWIDYKRNEIAKVSRHPSPADFEQYFDC
ncbi:type I glutamate--ammonia ligase [Candidatus Roizmanbacteria bacterium]|nr:type I glutamate--ammonia ligase [Candidatus Roizmanbacteria bacterium]